MWLFGLCASLLVETIRGVWTRLGTTSYGYWLVPLAGAFVGVLRSKGRLTVRTLLKIILDALSAVVLVFVLIFAWEFIFVCKAFWSPHMSTAPILTKWDMSDPKILVRNNIHSPSLGDDIRKLSADILSDSTVRERMASVWWDENARQIYAQKFIESDNQFDIEFAVRISNVFSRLDAKSVSTNLAREQFKNHDLISLGFTLEQISRKLLGVRDRILSAEDKQFLIYRFGLNAHGEHNPSMNVDRDSTMLVYADSSCKECMSFAEQIRQCAYLAKWKVNPAVEPSPVSMRSIRGITVHGNPDGLGDEPGEWLNKMGFETASDSRTDAPPNPMEVQVFVGKK